MRKIGILSHSYSLPFIMKINHQFEKAMETIKASFSFQVFSSKCRFSFLMIFSGYEVYKMDKRLIFTTVCQFTLYSNQVGIGRQSLLQTTWNSIRSEFQSTRIATNATHAFVNISVSTGIDANATSFIHCSIFAKISRGPSSIDCRRSWWTISSF